MKYILSLSILISVVGCANFDGEKFKEGFASGMQYRYQIPQQNQQPLQQYTQNNPVKRLDQQCFQQCTQSGYQYPLCQSKCSY